LLNGLLAILSRGFPDGKITDINVQPNLSKCSLYIAPHTRRVPVLIKSEQCKFIGPHFNELQKESR